MSAHPAGAPVPGASLPRLLARLQGREPVQQHGSPTGLLGEWVDWQRAVALSRALDGAPFAESAHAPGREAGGAAPAGPDGGDASRLDAGAEVQADGALFAECARVRGLLADAILDDGRDWTRPLWPRAGEDPDGAAAGASAVQRHCQGLQRDLQSATGRLRGELRERLACRGAGQARLAAVDAVMEGLLAPREHALLAPLVPTLVARFEQLHAAHAGSDDAAVGSVPWRAAFRAEARQLLLAELDLRFHPIEALLEALQSPRPDA